MFFELSFFNSILQRKVITPVNGHSKGPCFTDFPDMKWRREQIWESSPPSKSRLILDLSVFNSITSQHTTTHKALVSFELQMTQHYQNSWFKKSLWVSCGNWGRPGKGGYSGLIILETFVVGSEAALLSLDSMRELSPNAPGHLL